MRFLRQLIVKMVPVALLALSLAACANWTHAQSRADVSLSLAPASGAYLVGSTFEVSILLDTHGQTINTVELHLTFPPDILQVIKPSGGTSLIQSWALPPSYSNSEGTLSLTGGISAGGINTSSGLITTVMFRAVAPGDASLSLLKTSRVLAHDGKGTDVLGARGGALFTVRVRPPEGPEVFSNTNPDPGRWSQNNAPVFSWQPIDGAQGYSYAFDENPEGMPAPEVMTTDLVKAYTDIPDGIRYFHLRVFKDGAWSGATHFSIRIDSTAPSAFTPNVNYTPQLGTPPIVFFETKDVHAGLDHYTVKVIRTDMQSGTEEEITPYFVETESPYKVPVEFPGKYSVIVRAFDAAGNSREASVQIVTPTVALLSEQGIRFRNYFVPFKFIYAFFGLLLAALFLWGMYLLRNMRSIRIRMRRDIASLSEDMQKEYMRFGEHFTHELEGRLSASMPPEPPAANGEELPEPPGPQI